MITEWLIVLLTVVIALFTFLVWRVDQRIAWFTGAMESHSDIMLRIEAMRGIQGKPIKLMWWDPTIAPLPTKRKHGEEIDLSTIRVYVPPRERSQQKSWWESTKDAFQ